MDVMETSGRAGNAGAVPASRRALDPDQALIVECRFFGGLELHEIATLLGVSEVTVSRHWRATRAWLAAALRRAEAR